MTPVVMSSAQTFEAWATGAAAITTAVAIFLGGTWAVWRFLLPGLFGAGWEGGIASCSARMMENGHFMYVARFQLKNVSYTPSVIEELAMRFSYQMQSGEEHEAWLDANALKQDEMCQSGVARWLSGASDAAPPLRDGIFVSWRIKFRKPRWGIGWLGWEKLKRSSQGYVPVDAESLTLYSKWREPFGPEKGKEETS